MKKLCIVFCLILSVSLGLQADDRTREAQQFLKDQGFYYGEVDGQGGAETSAAIRRYQIRNGLEVNGQLNQQTLDSMKPGNTPLQPASEPQQPLPTTENPEPPARHHSVFESDREFLKKQSQRETPPVENIAPPPVLQASDYATFFRKTPYETAPREVQSGTLKRAQSRLYREGFYNGPVDGIPGAATERAILRYQSDADLKPSGRLDMDTLADMNLLPNRAPVPFFHRLQPPREVYRGIWVR